MIAASVISIRNGSGLWAAMKRMMTPRVHGAATRVPFLSLGRPPGVPQRDGKTWKDAPITAIATEPYKPTAVPAAMSVDDDGL